MRSHPGKVRTARRATRARIKIGAFVRGETRTPGLHPTGPAGAPPAFAPLSAFETIAWDYRAGDLSPRGHPLGPLRGALRAQGLPDAKVVAALPHGQRVRYAGLVICRQRPGTAAGVTFLTLEDETGFVNLVIWAQVFEKFPILARTAILLGVDGRVQKADGVTHLIADTLWEPELDAPIEGTSSRDFH